MVLKRHTAPKLDSKLRRSFDMQSLVTGLPLMAVDCAISAITLLAVAYVVHSVQGYAFNPGTWKQVPALLLLQVGLLSLHHLYPGAGLNPVHELRGVVRSSLFAAFCLSAMNAIFGQLTWIEIVIFAITGMAISLVLPLARSAAREFLSRTSWWGVRAILIGSHHECQRILSRMPIRRTCGFVLVGYVCPPDEFNPDYGTEHLLGSSVNAFTIARHERAPVAMVASHDENQIAHRLMFQFPSVVWVGSHTITQDASSDLIYPCSKSVSMPLLRVTPRLCKRGLDIAICIPLGVILALPMLLIAVAIKLRSPGPVFYASSRIGRHGKQFRMWKFRSMVVNADEVLRKRIQSDPKARREWQRDSKLKDDPRIIPGVGHLLRRWSLDELPQLWNVLTGEMSLVGPRPLLPNEIVRYQNHFYDYTQMWPGVTGLWQVSGRNETTFDTRIFLVHNYATNWSLWLDACILLKTPLVVLSRHGAY